MAIFATKKFTASTSKKGVRVTPKPAKKATAKRSSASRSKTTKGR